MPRTQVRAGQLAAADHAVVSDASGTVTVDCSTGQQTVRAEATLTAAGRTVALSGDSDGQRVEIVLRQDGTGSRTVTTWPATVAWRNGSAPTLRTAAGAVDVVVLSRLASGEYLGYHDAASGGGGGWTAVDASETVKGIAELATQAETDAGTDDARIVTPLKLATTLAANSMTFGKGLAQAMGVPLP